MRELHTAVREANHAEVRKEVGTILILIGHIFQNIYLPEFYKLGISFYPILMELELTPLNRGYVYDQYHFILSNISSDFYKLWRGEAAFDSQASIEADEASDPGICRDYIIPEYIWERMGREMERAGKSSKHPPDTQLQARLLIDYQVPISRVLMVGVQEILPDLGVISRQSNGHYFYNTTQCLYYISGCHNVTLIIGYY